MPPMRRCVLFAVVLLAACTSAAGNRLADSAHPASPDARPSSTDVAAARQLPASEQAALVRLASLTKPIDPATADEHPATVLVSSLPAADQARFDAQVAVATAAATRLRTTADA